MVDKQDFPVKIDTPSRNHLKMAGYPEQGEVHIENSHKIISVLKDTGYAGIGIPWELCPAQL